LAMAEETPEIKALSEKGMALRPLLKATWDDLRSRLSAGEMTGYLVEPDSGKIYKIDAHRWNRDDANVAHITGWFSIPHAWGHFEGPVVLVRSDFQQRVTNQGAAAGLGPPPLTSRGRSPGKSWQASDERFFKMMASLLESHKARTIADATRIVVDKEPMATAPNTEPQSAEKRLARSYPKWVKAKPR